jgi:syntaxin 1B/2/3
MQPLAGNGAPYSATPQPRDPNAILNDCRAVGRAIDDLENRLNDLQRLQRNFVSGTGASNKEVDGLSADIMSGYRGLADRVKRIKGQPDAANPRNKAQVEALDRRIRKAINHYQQIESQFRKEVQEQQRRQYLIVRPDATESEIREATEAGGDTQIFQQALMNADRRGQAQSTLRNVQQRHDAIQQIERTMIELQQLFQDLDAIVVEQEAPVMAIEQKAEETHTHLEAGNVHVAKAVDSARAARKKKWICLGICSKCEAYTRNTGLDILTLFQFPSLSSLSLSSLSTALPLVAGSMATTTPTTPTINPRTRGRAPAVVSFWWTVVYPLRIPLKTIFLLAYLLCTLLYCTASALGGPGIVGKSQWLC